ncbi:MAG: GFA family protein [Pseudohongiellaceae bacterium]
MSTRKEKQFEGSCHCGAIQFKVTTNFPELTTCDCSICRRKNALMVKVHEEKFELVTGEDQLSMYQFHTNTAKHYFCSVCGIYPFHRKKVAPDFYGVNVYCLEGADIENVPVRATDGIGMS